MRSVLDEIHGELGGPPAGFWRRFVAALIDGVVVAVVGDILGAVLGHRPHSVQLWVSGGNGFGLLISAVYFTFFHGRTGQTPGNAALGIRVVDARSRLGEPIGYGRALLRWVVSLVSGVLIGLGYLWMLWDGRKQTWHDKAAGSLPVRVGN
jgi:uncharacterized RDD family membrane protein YckC